jgi:hypothetical protein
VIEGQDGRVRSWLREIERVEGVRVVEEVVAVAVVMMLK